MIINGTNNQKLEFKIVGYQFPNAEAGSLDADWLNIFIDVRSVAASWRATDPSLTVAEFKEIVNWFRDLSIDKKVEYPNLSFIEPTLDFNLVAVNNDSKNIKIIFNGELKPEEAEEGKEYFIDFQFSNKELMAIASELENELGKIRIKS